MLQENQHKTGSYILEKPWVFLLLTGGIILVGYLISIGGLAMAMGLVALPPILLFLNRLFVNPRIGLFTVLILAFTAIGINRYITGLPLGLSIDIMLILTWVAVFFKFFNEKLDMAPFKSDLTLLSLVWFIYAVLQFFNPEALSKTAWFYAMRGVAMYPLLIIPLTYLLFGKVKYLNYYLYIWAIFTILASIKGWMQLNIGPDFAEQRWLDQGGAVTHILFGELRVFSFFSDAGQFGAAQGAAGIAGIVLAINAKNLRNRILFTLMAVTGLYGMMISGTRGAMIVPMIGGFVYVIHRKNIRVIILGTLILMGVYSFFKFTYIGQGVAQIRRMRTAFEPEDDASLQIRLENRRILQDYLKSRPFGGGIGSAGNWGKRFSPNGFLAQIATDSWYVQIWAEQGVVGLAFHLLMLTYIVVKGSYLIMFKVRDPVLRGKLSALMAAFTGIMGASYGNGVLGQMPTGALTYMAWVFMFLAEEFDEEIQLEKEKQKQINNK
ncbi:MAG: O-antigen ligase family protein [Bacteroidales bacterium]|nr:O-antigen ligase family protein [Bacteroidales bacterium]MCF8343869.1 O-antigen ligase family protein [Bacteroidales bacterium]MCF8351885.1 O-antigen ligase family protein [Bacteroidales bacterium]MCF8375258.1 O-antigen ligase family protein [Bacteroidales bacterium]MCF8400282.1 O-antigen ligase family protein [Bacteroidales bacterium]